MVKTSNWFLIKRTLTSDSTNNIRKLVQEIDFVIDVRVLLKIWVRGGCFDIILNVVLNLLDLHADGERLYHQTRLEARQRKTHLANFNRHVVQHA